MSSDDEKNKTNTARPPAGDDDVYSASTVIGPASADILEILRANKAAAAAEPVPDFAAGAGTGLSNDSDAPTRVGRSMVDIAVPPAAKVPEVDEVRHDAKPSHGPVQTTDSSQFGRALPPAVGIVALFVAVAAVLAVLVR